jgi:hypothetical protein
VSDRLRIGVIGLGLVEGRPVRSDGEAGLRVVRVLEALQRSLEESARPSI